MVVFFLRFISQRNGVNKSVTKAVHPQVSEESWSVGGTVFLLEPVASSCHSKQPLLCVNEV